jgi:predicted transcriptional regulator
MARRPPGALETAVVEVLQQAGRSLSVAEVVEGLAGQAAYTTVMTTLVRLLGKGVLVRRPRGRGFVYGLAVDGASVSSAQTARRMRRLLDQEGRRADVLSRFVAELGPDDEQLLMAALRDRGRPDGPVAGG